MALGFSSGVDCGVTLLTDEFGVGEFPLKISSVHLLLLLLVDPSELAELTHQWQQQ